MRNNCTAHAESVTLAEVVRVGGLTHIVLRCPTCQGRRGMRLVRKEVVNYICRTPLPARVVAIDHGYTEQNVREIRKLGMVPRYDRVPC